MKKIYICILFVFSLLITLVINSYAAGNLDVTSSSLFGESDGQYISLKEGNFTSFDLSNYDYNKYFIYFRFEDVTPTNNPVSFVFSYYSEVPIDVSQLKLGYYTTDYHSYDSVSLISNVNNTYTYEFQFNSIDFSGDFRLINELSGSFTGTVGLVDSFKVDISDDFSFSIFKEVALRLFGSNGVIPTVFKWITSQAVIPYFIMFVVAAFVWIGIKVTRGMSWGD